MPTLPEEGVVGAHYQLLYSYLERFHWCHGQVLWARAHWHHLQQAATPYKVPHLFCSCREKPQPRPKAQGGLLSTRRDRQVLVDLGRLLKFPDTITATTLRPYMVLISNATKQKFMLESSPLERQEQSQICISGSRVSEAEVEGPL